MNPILLLLAALAHDFWIEPATFAPQPGEIVAVRLRVGQDLMGDPVPRDPSLVDRFVVHDAAGDRPVIGRAGADPAGLLRVDANGLSIVGYQSHASRVEMPAEKFNLYLKEEGLDRIPRQSATVHEMFSRCAKSLVLTGPAAPAQSDRALGFTLELIAEKNPYASPSLPVRLLYQGRPMAGALVVAFNRRNPAERQAVRTDQQGRATFRVVQPGLWLVKAVHMIPAPKGAGAEWASYWASLTFETK
jgi:uncharacterized GH25 family protein